MKIVWRILLSSVAGLSLLGCAHADTKKEENHNFGVLVFDCEIEIPSYYKLNTREKSSFKFINIDKGTGSISISDYDASVVDSDRIAIEGEEQYGDIIVYSLRVEQGSIEPAKTVLIHNKKRAITLIGDATSLKDMILESCRKNRIP